MILEHGLVWNFDSLALRINSRKGKAADFKRVNQPDFPDTRISGKIAWLYYRNKATISANGKTFAVRWLESAVLVRDEKNGISSYCIRQKQNKPV